MNTRKLRSLAVLGILIIGAGLIIGCAGGAKETPTSPPAPQLSEQPDQATFRKYFSEMGLGKLPVGGQLPLDLQQNVNVFAPGDQICLYGTLIQEVQAGQISAAIYDLGTKSFVGEKVGLPKPLSRGGFASTSGPTNLPAGKYEYKVYVGDVLVAVFPFEIR